MPMPGACGLLGFTDAASKYSGTFGSGARTTPAGAENDCANGRAPLNDTRAMAPAAPVAIISLCIVTPRWLFPLDTATVPIVSLIVKFENRRERVGILPGEWRDAHRTATACDRRRRRAPSRARPRWE